MYVTHVLADHVRDCGRLAEKARIGESISSAQDQKGLGVNEMAGTVIIPKHIAETPRQGKDVATAHASEPCRNWKTPPVAIEGVDQW